MALRACANGAKPSSRPLSKVASHVADITGVCFTTGAPRPCKEPAARRQQLLWLPETSRQPTQHSRRAGQKPALPRLLETEGRRAYAWWTAQHVSSSSLVQQTVLCHPFHRLPTLHRLSLPLTPPMVHLTGRYTSIDASAAVSRLYRPVWGTTSCVFSRGIGS